MDKVSINLSKNLSR